MLTKNKTECKAHNKKQYVEYVDNAHDADLKNWDMSVYWLYHNKCMHCGCPESNQNMFYSTSPYFCRVCDKKIIGEELSEKRIAMFDEHEKMIDGLSIREINKITKRKLKGISQKGNLPDKEQVIEQKKQEAIKVLEDVGF